MIYKWCFYNCIVVVGEKVSPSRVGISIGFGYFSHRRIHCHPMCNAGSCSVIRCRFHLDFVPGGNSAPGLNFSRRSCQKELFTKYLQVSNFGDKRQFVGLVPSPKSFRIFLTSLRLGDQTRCLLVACRELTCITLVNLNKSQNQSMLPLMPRRKYFYLELLDLAYCLIHQILVQLDQHLDCKLYIHPELRIPFR